MKQQSPAVPGCLMLEVGSLADGKVMNIIGMFPSTSSLLREAYRSILHDTQKKTHNKKKRYKL